MKKLLLTIITSLTLCGSIFSQVVINEYSCANKSQFVDNNAKYEDWIELYNDGGSAVNLGGYYLSDNIDEPTKWMIPNGTTIGANGFLRFWCSGRNMVSGAHYHTSFHLTQSKDEPDYVVLADANGAILEQHSIERHQLGHSIGRRTNGSSTWGIFTTPTANSSNNTSTQFLRYAETPATSIHPGNYKVKFILYLSTNELNSTIRYTKDGSLPTTASPLYSAASGVRIDSTCTVVKAVTFSSNASVLKSFIEINTYFIRASHNLPVISLSGSQLDVLANGDNMKRPAGSFEYFDKDWLRKAVTYGGFNSHGQDSWANDQRSLDFKTFDEDGYDYAIREKLFSLSKRDEFQGIIIRAAGDDNYPAAHHASNEGSAHIRDAYVQNMAIQGGLNVDVRTAEKAIVYLNGKYWGVYDMRERADEHDYTKFYYNQDKYNIQYILTWGGTWSEYGGSQSITDWGNLRNYIMSKNMANDSIFAIVETQLDPKSLADYVIVNSVAVCSDWLNYNTGWWRGKNPQGGHQRWGYTLWDDDATFGFYINYTGVPDTGASAKPCNVESGSLNDPEGHIDLLQRLRQNKKFNQWYISRYIDLSNTIYSQKSMLDKLDSTINLLKPEMTQHAKRWFGTYNEWYKNAQRLRYFVLRRTNAMPAGINQCYNTGGPYKTTFKVEPAVAGNLQINSLIIKNFPYTGNYYSKIDTYLKGIPNKGYEFDYWTVKKDTIKPDSTAWDAILRVVGIDTVIAHFKVRTDLPKLNFTEVNYDNDITRNSGSWFELSNYGNKDIDLSGWKISSGTKWKEYVFPKNSNITTGSRWLFVVDTVKFKNQYGSLQNVVYVNFKLSSRKEPLTLTDTLGTILLDLPFDNDQPWPLAANGAGRTMELKQDSLDCSNPDNWRNGCIGGSPGASFTTCNELLQVSEINYNSSNVADAGDWFEIYNQNSTTLDLSGCKYRNKNFRPVYVFPSGTTLTTGEYIVVCEDTAAFHKVHPGVNNILSDTLLKLDNSTDFIRIYNPNDTLVYSVAYADNINFTPQADGKGFTLEYNQTSDDYSHGRSWSANCFTGSPGVGMGNCEGGIAFTEINVKSAPFNDAGDWFEIKNTSANTYNLAGWSVSDSSTGGFVLPAISLKPQDILVIVADSTKFKAQYPNIKNFSGDINFNLSSSGEKLRIFNTSQKLVNIMEYRDSVPWPGLVSGNGYTMEIRDTSSDPSEGKNWFRGCLGGSPGEAYAPCYDSVVVAEINYNSHTKADAGDWLELWNRGSQSVDISGWLFQDDNVKDSFLISIGTILQPNDRLVLANDSAKLKKMFPFVSNVQGDFNFGLSSAGDMLKLRDANGRLRFGMLFNSDSTWPQMPNGGSYTLELAKDSFIYSEKRFWTTACPAGSPGKAKGNCEGSIVFTELNYNSEPGMNAGDWAELYNTGMVPMNLNNYIVTNADSSKVSKIISTPLMFQGDYKVLVTDTAKFDALNPGVARTSGNMTVDLSNAGGRIRLTDPTKKLVATASFDIGAAWPQAANGKGKTLERKDIKLDPDQASTWFDGCLGGSPGMAYQPCSYQLVVSEINYQAAANHNTGKWIELHNRSTSRCDIGGYTIRNKTGQQIVANGISISGKGHLVLADDSLLFTTINPGVAFVKCSINWQKQDEIKLYNAAGKLVYFAEYSNQIPWPQDADGQGYTLEYVDSATDHSAASAWFSGCYGGSPSSEYGICVSPVIVSEINYQSNIKADAGDWLELLNNSNKIQDLSGWKIAAKNAGASYTIPNGRLLKQGERIVFTNNPVAFKNFFPTITNDSGLFVLGSTEELTLTDANGRSLFTFTYTNSSGWPVVFGNSFTLEFDIKGDANLGNSWFKGCPGGSPGTGFIPCTGQLAITEINYNSTGYVTSGDWVEIMNTGNLPVLATDFLLVNSDSSNVHSIQSNDLLYPGDRLVLCESKSVFYTVHNIPNVEGGTGMNLKDAGEIIKLYDARKNLLYKAAYKNGNGWPEVTATGRSIEYASGNAELGSSWMEGCIGGSPGSAYATCNYPLTISEINFNSSPLLNTGDWLELHNTTSTAIDLNGYTIKGQNMSYTFGSSKVLAPLSYTVLYNDAAFNTWWSIVADKTQTSLLDLGNGDKVDIFSDKGLLKVYANYQTGTPWPTEPNGEGHSLELADTASNPTIAQAWFAGCFGGTPGEKYQLPCDYTGISSVGSLDGLDVYPNPNNGTFTLILPHYLQQAKVTIFDALGRLVYDVNMTGNRTEIVLTNLPAGIYSIRITHAETIIQDRWIKQ
ncbi:MAG: T9SS type A sorting domain-containing protein [Flavobacteriaceae bacterium]|nr:T9SS type A sorting domain-containing protein [Flavobacteriaceae bacterium]